MTKRKHIIIIRGFVSFDQWKTNEYKYLFERLPFGAAKEKQNISISWDLSVFRCDKTENCAGRRCFFLCQHEWDWMEDGNEYIHTLTRIEMKNKKISRNKLVFRVHRSQCLLFARYVSLNICTMRDTRSNQCCYDIRPSKQWTNIRIEKYHAESHSVHDAEQDTFPELCAFFSISQQ